jgi:hypothetical protein
MRFIRENPHRSPAPKERARAFAQQLQICFRTFVLGRRGQFSDRIALKSEKSCM